MTTKGNGPMQSSTASPEKLAGRIVTQNTAEGPITIVRDSDWFGRRRAVDFRDHNFLIPKPEAFPEVTHKVWAMPRDIRSHELPLDQGPTPRCVAFAATHLLMCGPIKNRRAKVDRTAAEIEKFAQYIYHECQLNDEWPGEDYDGTSVRAAMKVLNRMGYITSYGWAFDIETLLHYVLTTGPMQLGVDWTDTMSSPTTFKKDTFITLKDGVIEGGHSLLAIGADLKRKCPDGSQGAVRLLNNWGEDWGDQGRVWISTKDMETLLHSGGEAATPVEITNNDVSVP